MRPQTYSGGVRHPGRRWLARAVLAAGGRARCLKSPDGKREKKSLAVEARQLPCAGPARLSLVALPAADKCGQAGVQVAAKRRSLRDPVRPIHGVHCLYTSALAAVKGGQDLPDRKIFVCPVCGNTVYDEAPETCPICGVAGKKSMAIE